MPRPIAITGWNQLCGSPKTRSTISAIIRIMIRSYMLHSPKYRNWNYFTINKSRTEHAWCGMYHARPVHHLGSMLHPTASSDTFCFVAHITSRIFSASFQLFRASDFLTQLRFQYRFDTFCASHRRVPEVISGVQLPAYIHAELLIVLKNRLRIFLHGLQHRMLRLRLGIP